MIQNNQIQVLSKYSEIIEKKVITIRSLRKSTSVMIKNDKII